MRGTRGKTSRSWLPAYLILGFVWGCSFIFIKLGLEFLTPFGVAFVRCALGAATLLLIAKWRGYSMPKDPMIRFHLWVVAVLLNVIPGIFYAWAETVVTSVLAGIINAVTPLMTLLAIMVVNRVEKPKAYQIIGLLIGFLGVLTVLGAWNGLGDNPLWAIVVLMSAVTCYGISEYEFNPGPILAVLALGVFGSGIAYLWNFKVMELAGSAIASSVTYLTPVVAIIVGIIFLGEKVTWYEPVGGLIVLFGAALAQGRIPLRKGKSDG